MQDSSKNKQTIKSETISTESIAGRDDNRQCNKITINNNSIHEIPTLISELGNEFIDHILNKVEESELEEIKDDVIAYRPDLKIKYNGIVRYKNDIDVTMNFNEKFKEKVINYKYGEKTNEFYRFFRSIYKELKHKISNADDLLHETIEQIKKEGLQKQYVDKTRFNNIALYFTLHAFIECKILEKPPVDYK